MRFIPLLLIVTGVACSGGSSGSSTSAGPTGSNAGSGSTSAAGAGTTASSTGSTGKAATSSGAGSTSSKASASTSTGSGSSTGTTTGSSTGSGGPSDTIGTPCAGPADSSCPASAPTCVEGRIDGGYFCSVACSGEGLNCNDVGGLDNANVVYCDATGYCVIECGRVTGYDAGGCPPGEVCDNFACQPGTTGTVPFGTLGTLCTGPDDTSCPPSAPDCVEGGTDGGYFCSLPCDQSPIPCAIAGSWQDEGTPYCVSDNYCAVLCGDLGEAGNFGTCAIGQFCTGAECLKAPDTIGSPCTGPSDHSCPEWSTDCVETGTNTGDFICTYGCESNADCLIIGSVSGTPYCGGNHECAIACGGDAGVCPSGLVCVTGSCQ